MMLPLTVNLSAEEIVNDFPALIVRFLHDISAVEIKSPSMIASIDEVGELFDHEVV